MRFSPGGIRPLIKGSGWVGNPESCACAARGFACALTRGALERRQVLHRGAGCGDADAVVRGVLRRGYALAVACWTPCECSDARTACRSTAARRHLLPDLRRPERRSARRVLIRVIGQVSEDS